MDPYEQARRLVRDYVDGQPDKHAEQMEPPESMLALAIGEALEEKQTEVERLRAALEQYADPNNWSHSDVVSDFNNATDHYDSWWGEGHGPELAIAALQEE